MYELGKIGGQELSLIPRIRDNFLGGKKVKVSMVWGPKLPLKLHQFLCGVSCQV